MVQLGSPEQMVPSRSPRAVDIQVTEGVFLAMLADQACGCEDDALTNAARAPLPDSNAHRLIGFGDP
jgi:hypothetical protein